VLCLTILIAGLTIAVVPTATIAQSELIADEAGGHDSPATGPAPVPDPIQHERALLQLPGTGLLLIPESTNDRVMAFDPTTGDLVDADFIPADPTNLSTPIQAILASDGNSILVSDQIDDVVQQYALDGTYIGVFAPAGGVDNSILDNIRGMALRPNGDLLVTVGGGANISAIAEFDTSGSYLGNFVANGAAGLNSPFDVLEVTSAGGSLANGEWLVGGITSDAIHHYDASGGALANLAALDTFAEQLAWASNGNLLIANFSGTQEGVVEMNNIGGVVGVYDPASLGGYRGAYELPNGNILTTNGSGVYEIDRSGAVISTKISGVSARFITFAQGTSTADLEITKVASPPDPLPGADVVYTITVSNLGPGTATNVQVVDTLPAEVSYVGDTCGGTNSPPWTWAVGDLAFGDPPASCQITVTVGASATGSFPNSASATTDSIDPDQTNSSAAATVTVQQLQPAIPTLGIWGSMLFAALVLVSAWWALRRR
jgi:uncharacterized repeat protein (TIGR01451 family)